MMIRSDAYFEGQEAAENGAMAADCPYEFESSEGMDWLDGLASIAEYDDD